MKYCPIVVLLLLTAGVLNSFAVDYPSEKELWKIFTATPGNRIHANRVFVNPGRAVTSKMSSREKRNITAFNERNAARVNVRRQTLNRIWSDFAPGEKALVLCEKYDLFHGKQYAATVITQRTMYVVEINENKEKGDIFRKYDLTPDTAKTICARASAISLKDGSCELVDSTTYPAFISTKNKNGKWTTAVFVSSIANWKKPPEHRAEYFAKTRKIMEFISAAEFIKESSEIPQVIIKK